MSAAATLQSPRKKTHSVAAPRAATPPKYMMRRGGVYYFKRRIPSDVPHAFPQYRGQVWKSLGTDNFERAKLQLAVEVTQFDVTISDARARVASRAVAAPLKYPSTADTTKYLLPAHIPALLARFQYELTENFDGLRKLFPAGTRAEFRNALVADLAMYRDLAAADAFEHLEPVVQRILAEERLIAPPGSAVRAQLLQAALQSHIETLESNLRRLQGKVDPLPALAPVAARKLPTLLLLFEDWKKKQTRARTIGAVRKAVLEFHSLHGALPVQAITRAHARDYRDHLIGQSLSDGTIVNRLGFLATLIRHGHHELIEELADKGNPFDDIKVNGGMASRAPKDRRAYNTAELNQLFRSRLYCEGYRPKGQASEAAYWAPLLGPFLGARIEEVAQLRVEDVECINGVWSIRICDLDEQQKVKTAGSFRRVPIHDEVIRCGFLRYVAQQKLGGQARVFPSLSNSNQNKVWSNSLGKWFGRYLDSIGLCDPRLDYHSFRYAFKQRLTLCGVESETRDALTGHWSSSGNSGRTYMKAENRQYPFPKLVSAMRQLKYDELVIEHLYVAEPMKQVEEVLLR